MVRIPWPAAAMLLALAACAAPPAKPPAAPLPAAVVTAPEAPAAPEPVVIEPAAPEPPLDPRTMAVIEDAIAALSPPEATPPEVASPAPPVIEAVIEAAPEPDIDDDPGQLMGLAGGALAELLGEPGLLREEADAQVWLYRGSDCMLDIYLYRDGANTPHLVTYYEFRGDALGRPCLRALLLAQAR